MIVATSLPRPARPAGRLPGFALVAALLFVVPGCGDDGRLDTAAVSGTVTYNGAPLGSGSLVFVPISGGPAAQGKITSGGDFVMGTYEDDDGVVPGEYQVMITALTAPGGSGLPEEAVDGNTAPVSLIPERYGDLEKSGLRAVVKADDDNEIDFELTDEPPAEADGL